MGYGNPDSYNNVQMHEFKRRGEGQLLDCTFDLADVAELV